MVRLLILINIFVLAIFSGIIAQSKTILVPQRIAGAPFVYDDQRDHFGKAYRWFLENETDSAVVNLKKVISNSGYTVQPDNYYVVVAHFTDDFAPIGIIHENMDFYSTRMYGLSEHNLFYIFVSRTPKAPSFLSVLATSKSSPFLENLPGFLGLFGILSTPDITTPLTGQETWVDVRRFTIPKDYRKFSDLSFIVKKDLADEQVLARAIFDNTAKEHWSYGVALALTTVRDLDLKVGSDGSIIVQPKPSADVSAFGVINYHFKAVDTKAKTFGTSIHLLGGLRIANIFEPLIGIGGGVSLSIIDVHAFVGYSVEFANELKDGFKVGDPVEKEVDPFKLKLRGKPRFGLELKFP